MGAMTADDAPRRKLPCGQMTISGSAVQSETVMTEVQRIRIALMTLQGFHEPIFLQTPQLNYKIEMVPADGEQGLIRADRETTHRSLYHGGTAQFWRSRV